jgi:hypothetical protein
MRAATAGQSSLGMQPGMHGASPNAMQLGTSMTTQSSVSKVKIPVHFAAAIYDGDSVFSTKLYDAQGSMSPGFAKSEMQTGGSKNLQHTYEQIVAFGGIQEEAKREVRSSGRLRAQHNADMTQMERATMIATKRAETPVIGMSTTKPTSITSFADDQIIDDARILGVSLGVSLSECTKSAKLIKDFEK